MAAELLQQNDAIPVSHNNARAVGVAHELKVLTADPDEVVVRPEAARAKPAACARMVRWCTAVARLRQGWLEGGSNLARVRRVMGRWRRSWRCNGTNASSSIVGALPSTRAEMVLTTQREESSKLEHGTARITARWGRVAD